MARLSMGSQQRWRMKSNPWKGQRIQENSSLLDSNQFPRPWRRNRRGRKIETRGKMGSSRPRSGKLKKRMTRAPEPYGQRTCHHCRHHAQNPWIRYHLPSLRSLNLNLSMMTSTSSRMQVNTRELTWATMTMTRKMEGLDRRKRTGQDQLSPPSLLLNGFQRKAQVRHPFI